MVLGIFTMLNVAIDRAHPHTFKNPKKHSDFAISPILLPYVPNVALI